ncbi:serine/threonine-protein kinase [Streptomyces sp. NPDC058655]|uniref:serine/threonine-protein kinase n=1 Tax=Streptomyces sp. NPDC058655 TaxID=3346577 RepID=UPI003648A3CA
MHPLRAERAGFPEYAGQYRLESVLGSGGMGVVHLATSGSGLRLAVKVVHAQHAVDPEFRARFRQEVAAARRVSGAFTAPVVDADPDAERPWMATLFIDAPTLAERVRERLLDEAEATRLGAGLAEALRDIHRAGVVHRDLKPSNVLMAPDGVRVIDFGISRPLDSDLRTETGKLIGTPPFMAPEQFQRPREVGPAADVFAMGAVLAHAATGRGPFDSDSHYLVAYQVVHSEPDLTGVPAALVPVIARCLAKDPAERPTPDALLGELRAAAYPTGEETRVFIPQPRRPTASASASVRSDEATHRRVRIDARPVARRRRPPATLAAALLLAGAAVGGYLAYDRAAGPGAGPAGPAGSAGAAAQAGPLRPWSASLAAPGRTSPAPACSWAADALFCSAPGRAAARIDPADGSVRWSAAAPAPAQGVTNTAAPLYADGLVVAVAPDSRSVRALDPGTGAQRWEHPLPEGARVVAAGKVLLLVTGGGRVTALDAATGAARWTRQIGGTGSMWRAGPGTAADAAAYVATPAADGGATQVSAVDPATGATVWQVRTGGTAEPVGVASGALHLLESGTHGRVRHVVRVDLRTRAVRQVPLSASLAQAEASVGDDGVVYVFGVSGSLAAVGRDGESWRVETGAVVASRPVPADGRVYLSVLDGRLLAVDAADGRPVGQTKARMGPGQSFTPVLPAPLTGGGRVYASAPDGTVFAVDARNPGSW